MENLTKEKLNDLLKKIREGRYDENNYHVRIPSMAMCYSIAFPRYNCVEYKGVHTCQNCKIQFGCNFLDSVEDCRKRKYEEYFKSEKGIISNGHCPCFERFLYQYKNNNEDILQYLKEHDLVLNKINENTSQTEKMYGYRRVRSRLLNHEDYVFNRKLTYDEWVKLNSSCNCTNEYEMVSDKATNTDLSCKDANICFRYDKVYQIYEDLAQKFRDKGFDVLIKYNCDDCAKTRNKIEFWFKLKDQNDYVISYPAIRYEKDNKKMSYIDYIVVLDFLCGNANYKTLISNNDKDRDDVLKKSRIDNAINTIIGTKIEYDKKEIMTYVNHFYGVNKIHHAGLETQVIDDNKALYSSEMQVNKDICDIAQKVFDEVDDKTLFDLDRYFAFMETIALYKLDKSLTNFSIDERKEIIYKNAKNIILQKKQTLNRNIIERWIDYKYSKSKIYEDMEQVQNNPNDKYYENCLILDKFIRKQVFEIFNYIYTKNGNDFEIGILEYNKTIKYLDKLFLDYQSEIFDNPEIINKFINDEIKIDYDYIDKIIKGETND